MSVTRIQNVSKEYNPNPEPESLSEVRDALMTRMDIMERNLGRVIQRVLYEVNALRKENEMLKEQLAKQTAAPENGSITQEMPEDYNVFLDAPAEESRDIISNKYPVAKKIKKEKKVHSSTLNSSKMSVYDDPLNELETKNTAVQFDTSTFLSFGGVLPRAPFMTIDEFEDFENELENDHGKFNALVIDFKCMACSQGEKYIRVCLRSILTDELAIQFTYYGTMTKKNFSATKTIQALRTAFFHKFGEFSEAFEKAASTYFHYTKDKMTKLERKRRKAEESV